MIIGNGDIASVLPDRDDLLFFASGVSNSQEMSSSEFQREIELLREQDVTKHVVYFSSLSIFYKDSPYTRHKKFMEGEIASLFESYTIVRIGNISWGKNPHTLINYLRAHPKAEIRDEYRYVIDKKEFLHWINLIPSWNCEMNCPGRMMSIKQIAEQYV